MTSFIWNRLGDYWCDKCGQLIKFGTPAVYNGMNAYRHETCPPKPPKEQE